MANRFNFRVWDNQHERSSESMVYPEQLGGPVMFFQWVGQHSPEMPLMQSTGLVDDSGIEVFEGDIVHDGCCDGTYPIKWDEGTASFVFYVNDPDEEVRHIQPGNSMEVVGNIYENPVHTAVLDAG